MEIHFRSFVTWALDGVKGQMYACACSFSTRYTLKSGLFWSHSRPGPFEEEEIHAENQTLGPLASSLVAMPTRQS